MQHAPSLHIEAFDVVGRIKHSFEAWRLTKLRQASYAKTVKELSSLTNRELADIGLNRSDITGVAQTGAKAL